MVAEFSRSMLFLAVCGCLVACEPQKSASEAKALGTPPEQALQRLAAELYPNQPTTQTVMTKVLNILLMHRQIDPFRGRSLPESTKRFGLDLMPIGFYNNAAGETSEVLVVDASGTFHGDVNHPAEACIDGQAAIRCFRYKDVPVQGLATQGEGGADEAAFFSYLAGADAYSFLPNYTPASNPKYLSKDHPLRKGAGSILIPLVASAEKALAMVPAEKREALILNLVDTVVHESYHIYEGNVPLSQGQMRVYNSKYQQKQVLAALQDDRNKRLMTALLEESHAAAETLSGDGADLPQHLANLSALYRELKTAAPDLYAYYVEMEYVEGFATFAAAQSMVDSGLMTYASQVENIYTDINDLYYRTGCYAMLVAIKLGLEVDWPLAPKMLYEEASAWEKIIPLTGRTLPQSDVDVLIALVDAVKAASEAQNIVDRLQE